MNQITKYPYFGMLRPKIVYLDTPYCPVFSTVIILLFGALLKQRKDIMRNEEIQPVLLKYHVFATIKYISSENLRASQIMVKAQHFFTQCHWNMLFEEWGQMAALT